MSQTFNSLESDLCTYFFRARGVDRAAAPATNAQGRRALEVCALLLCADLVTDLFASYAATSGPVPAIVSSRMPLQIACGRTRQPRSAPNNGGR